MQGALQERAADAGGVGALPARASHLHHSKVVPLLAAGGVELACGGEEGAGLGRGGHRGVMRQAGVAGQHGKALEAAAAAQVITVTEDLPKATLSADVLMNWLPAIACGKTVEVKQSKTRISFKAAIGISAAVQLSSEFAVKHKGLTLQLRKIMMQPSSKWHEVATGGVAIRDLHSFRSFLVRMQRRPLICGVSVPLAKPLAILGGVSRYGRPVVA